jgi:hypothetical protein
MGPLVDHVRGPYTASISEGDLMLIIGILVALVVIDWASRNPFKIGYYSAILYSKIERKVKH